MKWHKLPAMDDYDYLAETKKHDLRIWAWDRKRDRWTWLICEKSGLRIASGNERRLKDAKYMAEAVLRARKRL